MAAEQGIEVDEAGFRRLMAEQRARAKADAQAKKTGAPRPVAVPLGARDAAQSQFTGYPEVVARGDESRR